MLYYQIQLDLAKHTGRLKPTTNRSPNLVRGLIKSFPLISTRFVDTPDTKQHIEYAKLVAEEVHAITGDPRLTALGLWNDTRNYLKLKESFKVFQAELKRNGKLIPSLESEEREAVLRLSGLESLISEEMFRRYYRLVRLDRSRTIDSYSETSLIPFYELRNDYQEIIDNLTGEGDVRAISLGKVSEIENRNKRRLLYEQLGLPVSTISGYAESIWYVYLPMSYRYSRVYPEYEKTHNNLAEFEAIALSPEITERVFNLMRKLNSDSQRIKDELNSLFNADYIKHLYEKLIDDKHRRFRASVKSHSMAAIKAATDLLDMIGTFSYEGFMGNMRDLVRARFIFKHGGNPAHVLGRACTYLLQNGYEVVPQKTDENAREPQYSTEPLKRANGLYYSILKKNGKLIELQAISEDFDDELEIGERYHEGMLGRRQNKHFLIPPDVNSVLSPLCLRRVLGRAITLDHLNKNRQSPVEDKLVPFEVTVEYPVGNAELRIPLYENSLYADMIANIYRGLNQRFRVFANNELVFPASRIDSNAKLRIEVDDSNGRYQLSADDASQILPVARDTSTQAQCISAILEDIFRRNERLRKKSNHGAN